MIEYFCTINVEYNSKSFMFYSVNYVLNVVVLIVLYLMFCFMSLIVIESSL